MVRGLIFFLALQSFFLIPQGGATGYSGVPALGDRITTPRELLAYWAIYGLIGWWIWKGDKAIAQSKWLAVFIVWAAIGIVYPLSFTMQKKFFYINPFGLYFFHAILFFSIAWIILSGSLGRLDVFRVNTALVIIGSVHAAIVLLRLRVVPLGVIQ